ncbi:MAG: LytTR family DNA-binding domain-containing protein [Carboxylicivirga sp.]|jgi:two-component system LytT family response regulator|nr:LytTR family DNA-binding domain-containing protein [Carboxylicivirga sp.]
MKVVIIEDEHAAAENLKYLLNKIDPTIKIDSVLDSVKQAIEYLHDQSSIDLIFMDIHLADGLSFEIFDEIKLTVPVIFTTAYDEYAIKAFRVNSLDYLLKPNDEEELKNALEKFYDYQSKYQNFSNLKSILKSFTSDTVAYRRSYLVQQRDSLVPVSVSQIAYFTIDTGIVKAITETNKSYVFDKTLDELESELNPEDFFRANRQFIINRKSIESLQLYFNGKLILNINPKPNEKVVISKAKAPGLRAWLDL